MKAAQEVMPQTGVVAVLTALGLSVATYFRKQQPAAPFEPRPTPARALSLEERQAVLDTLHEPRFVDQAPAEIVATLMGEGIYRCSERTMYRILEEEHELRERRDQLRHPAYAKPELMATAPHQVWSWDITKLMTYVKFHYLYLYVVMDIFSRYVVGWLLAEHENGHLAEHLLRETCQKQGVNPRTLHSDRGAPMRSKPLVQLLAALDVARSYSRPQVSNDNPFSEAAFKTLKYHPTFPERFGGLEDGLPFCRSFFTWYNGDHHHSALQYLTPSQVHHGQAERVLQQRHQLKLQAYQAHPERFVGGPPRLQQLDRVVYLNPPTRAAAGAVDPVGPASSGPQVHSPLNPSATKENLH